MGRLPVTAFLILSLLPSAYLAWQGRDLPHLGSFHDDAIYFETARELALGHPYRIASLPWAPAQTKYPPLYPLYLSLAWRMAPDLNRALPIAMLLNWLWLPVWLAGIHRLLRGNGCSIPLATGLSVAIALHPEVQLASTRLMSDLMFAALVTWALALHPGNSNEVLRGLAYLTRTAGLPLYAGLLALEAWRRQWRSLAISIVCALVPAGLWAIWVATHKYQAQSTIEKYYTDYFAYQLEVVPLAGLPTHIYQQLDTLLSAIAKMLLLHFGGDPGWVMLERVVAVATIAGIARLMRRGQMIAFAAYALPATLMLLIWYFPTDPRALLPLLPLLALGFYTEAASFASVLGAAWRKDFAAWAVAALLIVPMTNQAYRQLETNGEALFALERGLLSHTREAYRWVITNSRAGQTFFAIDDPVFYLYTGHQALRLPDLDRIFAATPSGKFRPSLDTLAAMERYRLSCLFVSSKHFDPAAIAGADSLQLDLSGTALTERYRSSTEVIACRD